MYACKKLLVISGNQLFPLTKLQGHKDALIFMTEDYHACTYLKHHQHKLVLILAAMRAYADALRAAGFSVHYEKLDDHPRSLSFTDKLDHVVDATGIRQLVYFEMQDKSMGNRMARYARMRKLSCEVLESPMFLTPRHKFMAWRSKQNDPRMVDFYRWQRKRLNILMTDAGKPRGGRWSFDGDNRKRLPKSVSVPELPDYSRNPHLTAVKKLVRARFDDHPGTASSFALPTTRQAGLDWLQNFFECRFTRFGDYEDALTTRSDHVFHSVLSPLLNIGLLTPEEVVTSAIEFADREDVPLNCVEGFVRQIIGWREFMFGIYCTDGETMRAGNFWNHNRRISKAWYDGTTGMQPLDLVIDKANRIGWAHHIERLMVAGNLMVLAEVHPDDAYRWFMEMFIDSADWVMVPNVYGMALFADGGMITTKPYVCGSNYLRKMGDYPSGEWSLTLDGLFWRFIARHRPFFERQPRLALLCGHLDRQPPERSGNLNKAAAQFLNDHTEMMQEVA
jgi:deoxyribodipyrimidine photolyase-related protein